MTTRKALISGASIAGPALGYWLAEAGWDVTVVERAPALRSSGYPVDIRGTAVDVIRRMGLHDDVTAAGYEHSRLALLTPGGRRLCTLDFGKLLSDSNFGDLEITRGALSEILYRASADRVEYVFGDSIAALSETVTGVEITFNSGRAQIFDVVIGADGIHSNVRSLAFGDESQFIRHLGPYVAVWDLPAGLFTPGEGFLYSHPGRTAFVEYPDDQRVARAFLAFVHPAPGTVDRRDRSALVAAVRHAFGDDAWRTEEIIDTLPGADDVYFDTVSQVHMDTWSCGRVALVGDAAYAPSFLSGQGTSIALAGAYILAGELARHDRPEQAFDAYERRLRHYVSTNQKLALRKDSTVITRTRRQLWRRNLALCSVPLLQRWGLAHLLQSSIRTAATELTLSEADLPQADRPFDLASGRQLLNARPSSDGRDQRRYHSPMQR